MCCSRNGRSVAVLLGLRCAQPQPPRRIGSNPRSRDAGPVRCNGWFGPGSTETMLESFKAAANANVAIWQAFERVADQGAPAGLLVGVKSFQNIGGGFLDQLGSFLLAL